MWRTNFQMGCTHPLRDSIPSEVRPDVHSLLPCRGPSKLYQTTGGRAAPRLLLIECLAMNDSFSSKLAGMTLPDVDGNPVKLGSLWADHPAVVVFLRHYG